MNKKYIAPLMTDYSVYLLHGVTANQIGIGSGAGGDGNPDKEDDDIYDGGAKERYDDNANYGNIW